MPFKLELGAIADPDIRERILEPLVHFNEAAVGPGDHTPLVIALRDESGTVRGGLWGATGYEWLYVQLLAVPEEARGQGLGRALMNAAETEAIRRGCHSAWLNTHEFQARGFYERLGYVCFSELPNNPTGQRRFFLRKHFSENFQ